MKIGIDARIYGPKHGGIGRYVEQLLLELDKQDTTYNFVVFLRKDDFDTVTFNSTNIKKVLADIPWYSLQEQFKLSAIINKQKVDLMHFPHWNIPLSYTKPFVVTIHDLIMYHFSRKEATTKSWLTYWLKDAAHKKVVEHAVKNACNIISPSQFTKLDVVKTLKIPADNISVIYQGVTKLKKQDDITQPLDLKKYILYVGSAYPHKNVQGLCKAWKKYCQNNRDTTLVIAGKDDRFYQRLKMSELFLDTPNVKLLLGKSDKELGSLYKYAQAFVFPSLYEGFGLPPIEAMQFHLPVLSSSRSCMPEVLGEAAYYVDPLDVDAFANAIDLIISNQEVRQTAVSNIYKELNRYNWAKCATETINIYKKTLDNVD